jgi:hypothetical protein
MILVFFVPFVSIAGERASLPVHTSGQAGTPVLLLSHSKLWVTKGFPMNAAHFHLLVNHLPIFGAFLSLPLLLIAWWRREEKGVLLAAVVIISGDGAASIVTGIPTVSMKAMSEHEARADIATIIIVVAAILAVFLLCRYWKKPEAPRNWVFIALLVAMTVTSAAMAWTGYKGGQIRHSEVRAAEPVDADSE